jgi:hypothetical protein
MLCCFVLRCFVLRSFVLCCFCAVLLLCCVALCCVALCCVALCCVAFVLCCFCAVLLLCCVAFVLCCFVLCCFYAVLLLCCVALCCVAFVLCCIVPPSIDVPGCLPACFPTRLLYSSTLMRLVAKPQKKKKKPNLLPLLPNTLSGTHNTIQIHPTAHLKKKKKKKKKKKTKNKTKKNHKLQQCDFGRPRPRAGPAARARDAPLVAVVGRPDA